MSKLVYNETNFVQMPWKVTACILLFFSIMDGKTYGQGQTVSGLVYSEEGQPLSGAMVIIADTTIGTFTDEEGRFELVIPGPVSIIISKIGFINQKVPVNNSAEINVALKQIKKSKVKIVTTALGIGQKPDEINYAINEISGDELRLTGEINFLHAMADRVPGMNVIKTATGPAGSAGVFLRGQASMTSTNQPLVIVDGTPVSTTDFGQAGMWSGADEGDGAFSINIEDIEKVSVLKGAVASALYGVRAANGVILITSKSGTNAKGPEVEYSSRISLEGVYDQTNYQNNFGHGSRGSSPTTAVEGYNWGEESWGSKMDGAPVYQFDGVQRPYLLQPSAIRSFYKIAPGYLNKISVRNGNHYLSFTNLTGKNVVPNSGHKRTSVLIKGSTNFFEKLEIGHFAFYSNEHVKNRPGVSDSPGNVNYSVFILPPSINVEDLAGAPDKPGSVSNEQTNPGSGARDPGEELGLSENIWIQNPYWASWQYVNNDVKDRLIGSLSAKFNFSEFLFAQVRTGLDWQTRRDIDVTPYGTSYRRKGSVNESEHRARELNIDWMAGFKKRNSNLRLFALIGGNAMGASFEKMTVSATELKVPFYHSVTNSDWVNSTISYRSRAINSLFFYSSINFQNYLYLYVTGRADWLLTLNNDPTTVYYPSGGMGYVYSNFINLPDWASYGKLGFSIAKVGGPTPHLDRSHYSDPSQRSMRPPVHLLPHTSTEMEVNFSQFFQEDRIKFDLTWYRQQTDQDIVDKPLTRYPWASSVLQNSGKLQNQGVETALAYTAIAGEDLSWNSSINAAFNRSKVLHITNILQELEIAESRTRRGHVYHIVGEPFSSILVNEQQKDSTGNYIYAQGTGYPVRSNDRKISGTGFHPLTGGFYNRISYKNLSGGFLIGFKFGGKIYSGTNVRLTSSGLHQMTEEGREEGFTVDGVDHITGAPASWTILPNDVEGYWRSYARISNNFVYDASFITLRQASITYLLSENILRKGMLKNISLSLVGRNLILLHRQTENIGPESNYISGNAQGLDYFGYPDTRTFSIRLNATL